VSDAGFSLPDKDPRIAELEAALASARADISARDILIDTLRVQLARLRRMQFGTSSEKLTHEIAQLELALEEPEAEAVVASIQRADPVSAERPTPIRALPAHLPREEQRIEPEHGCCTCPDCGGALRPLGQDSDEMLDAVPVQWRVVRTIRPKYSCRSRDKVVQAAAPGKAIARGKATFATLAHVVVAKFDHHLPLYRQAEMMAAQGIELDRSTLAGWAGQASALLDPIVSRIREVGLSAAKIHTDDTPVPMLDPGRGKTATGRLWAYVVDDRGFSATSPPLVWYHFTQDRTGAHPRAQLGRFGGNDLLNVMGLRRPTGRTAYESPLGPVIGSLVATFLPWGFAMSAPVFERFSDVALLREEVARDIEHGLVTKSAIHPDQIAVIQGAFAVPREEVEEARQILAPDVPAVFAHDGVMCEPATHRAWAERLLSRASAFGVAEPMPLPIRA
jgi:transposase